MATTERTAHAVYAGVEELILSEPLGEPDFVLDGTLDEAKQAAKDSRWDELEEMFEAEEPIDPDWDSLDDVTYACSPLGFWVAIKPITLRAKGSTTRDPTEFRAEALAHYQGMLANKKARFGVKAISEESVEHNSSILTESDLWDDLAKQMGLKIIVSCHDDPQTVYMLVSDHEIPQPGNFYELWRVVTSLTVETDQDERERLCEDVASLHCYNGPFKMDVPEAVLEALSVD